MKPERKEDWLYYLDLDPQKISRLDGKFHYRKACRRLGTKYCFKDEHLYTLFFKEFPSDEIEKRFFGIIDNRGAKAVEFFSHYTLNGETERALHNLLGYLDAQKLRTPKGLDYIRAVMRAASHQKALIAMEMIWQVNITIWMEGVWEVLTCSNSETKFLTSDNPVTVYNKDLFPGSKGCIYPYDAPIELVGTHTIFPLDLNHCLVITNLEYVRNPKMNPRKIRENPRYFEQTIFDMRKVQTGRQINEEYVLAINYVMKKRAKRYIAAGKEEWLYPEKYLKTTMWNKIGGKLFLMPDPRKVTFSTGIYFGFESGRAWAQDEYGRLPDDNNRDRNKKRDEEFIAFQRAKQSWDSIFGPLSNDEEQKYM